jgi:hypothetical protein
MGMFAIAMVSTPEVVTGILMVAAISAAAGAIYNLSGTAGSRVPKADIEGRHQGADIKGPT